MAGKARAAIAALTLMLAPLAFVPRAFAQAPRENIDSLARDVDRLESLRQVKDVQRSYAQYNQFGLWGDAADLFAANGRIVWGEAVISGRGSHDAPAGRRRRGDRRECSSHFE